MKKLQISMISISLLAVILEILPFGVKCTFMDDGHVEIVRTYSYFNMTPYAYGNFFPFITAVLSC